MLESSTWFVASTTNDYYQSLTKKIPKTSASLPLEVSSCYEFFWESSQEQTKQGNDNRYDWHPNCNLTEFISLAVHLVCMSATSCGREK